MVKININEFVKVRLTEYGKKEMPEIPVDPCTGESRLVLWEFMIHYGAADRVGLPLICKNTLTFGDANEHPPFEETIDR